MRFLQKLFQARENQARENQATAPELATGDHLRGKVRANRAQWLAQQKGLLQERLDAHPPATPGDLFHSLEKLSQYAFELGLLDWREGKDPRPHFTQIERAFALALAKRPDILTTSRNPGFLVILSHLMGWGLPFDTSPPGEEERRHDMLWMERWIIAGLADPACWSMKANAAAGRNRFIAKCLDDYWALLSSQIDPAEGIDRCIRNYERRATHPTFKVLKPHDGGSEYNALVVDYTLAAILKKRGLESHSVHDWVWD